MKLSFVLAGVIAVLAEVPCARAESAFGVGFATDYGTAMLPPASGSALTTAISIHEYGGPIGNAILFFMTAPWPTGSSTARTSYYTDDHGVAWVVTETVTDFSQSDLGIGTAKYKDWKAAKGDGILRGDAGQELQIFIPLRQLGGDASGFMFKLMVPLGFTGGLLSIAALPAFGWINYEDVTQRRVSAAGGVLTATESVGNSRYEYVGFPIRFQTKLSDFASAHVQLDLNVFSLTDDQPSPIRAGVDFLVPHALLKVEAISSGLAPGGASLAAEAILAF